jgi:hypothetical protein
MSTPTPRYIRFDRDRKARWKVIPVKYVSMIANRSSKGIDWNGSNKNDILDSFEHTVRHGCDLYPDLFGELMDKAVVAMKKVRKFEDETMGAVFKQPPPCDTKSSPNSTPSE